MYPPSTLFFIFRVFSTFILSYKYFFSREFYTSPSEHAAARPARCNRGYFCKRGSSGHQDITVVTLPDRSHLIKYVEMGTRPRNNVMILSSSRHRHLDGSSRGTTTLAPAPTITMTMSVTTGQPPSELCPCRLIYGRIGTRIAQSMPETWSLTTQGIVSCFWRCQG